MIPVNNELSDLITVETLKADLKCVKKTLKSEYANSEDKRYYTDIKKALKTILEYYQS